MTSDRIFGAVMIVVALGYILSATTIQVPLFPDPMGPKMFPYLIAAGIIVCGIFMILRPDPEAEWPSTRVFLKLASTVSLLIAYAFALKPYGFIFPTAFTAAILSYQLYPKVVSAVTTGTMLSVGLFILFKYALDLGLVAFPKSWRDFFEGYLLPNLIDSKVFRFLDRLFDFFRPAQEALNIIWVV